MGKEEFKEKLIAFLEKQLEENQKKYKNPNLYTKLLVKNDKHRMDLYKRQ